MKNIDTLFLFCLVLSLSGCIKKPLISNPNLAQQDSYESSKNIQLVETNFLSLSDLPIPLGFQLVKHEEQLPISYCCYEGNVALEKIENFIQQDTERNGWQLETLATPHYQTYLISKPSKLGIIVHERKGTKALLHINIKNTERTTT